MEIIPIEHGDKSISAHATWTVPGSKSITNRALILGALCESQTVLEGVLHSDDTRHMINALKAMGVRIESNGPTRLLISGGLGALKASEEPIFVGNSGTSVRFLTTFAALIPGGSIRFYGDQHMAKRPIEDLNSCLRQMGVEIECPTGCPPLTIKNVDGLPGGDVVMNGSRSSQYFSSLLLSGAYARKPLRIKVEGELVSFPYIEMTMKMVSDFGGKIDYDPESRIFTVHPAVYNPPGGVYYIEPDASAASYAFAAAAALRISVTVPFLNRESLQGDFAFVDVLEQMGCTIEAKKNSTTVKGPDFGQPLKGVNVDMHDISDTVMTFAALAPLCSSSVTIKNVANIRIKETDRLLATVTELQRLGQDVLHGEDWMSINPKPVTPARIECYSDHRMAMSFAVLGLALPGIVIDDPKCTAKTYPGFWDDIEKVRKELKAQIFAN